MAKAVVLCGHHTSSYWAPFRACTALWYVEKGKSRPVLVSWRFVAPAPSSTGHFALLPARRQDTTTTSNGLHVLHLPTLSFMLHVLLFRFLLGPGLLIGRLRNELCPAMRLWKILWQSFQ